MNGILYKALDISLSPWLFQSSNLSEDACWNTELKCNQRTATIPKVGTWYVIMMGPPTREVWAYDALNMTQNSNLETALTHQQEKYGYFIKMHSILCEIKENAW